ncbi:hypothetical protein WN51_07862 [Melipona quadrifasciata]|uniref:Regulatory protein zeste n=1 Tax=Melipona quadrifasciata TaxID=166423 RepID=A0A0M9A6V3_9HYME|nr:hypothetical protein WN51_07862 [Melipona quadrifasciata]
MPRNLSEADRKKNQFDKEERVHLLAIMKQYAPLLDKSASTLARKKIWTTIEDEFKRAGFTRKTSAQLKKYWQNYKYHCKKATASFAKVFLSLPIESLLPQVGYACRVGVATIDKLVFSADVPSNEVEQQQQGNKGNWMNSRKQAGASGDEEAVTGFGYHDRDLAEGNDVGPRSNETNANKEYDWPECNEKQMGKLAREDGGDGMRREGEEKDAGGTKGRNSASENERGAGSRGYVFLADYRSRLKHRLLLQQLETEEKRLKVKIAEMAIQEVQLRIKALSEDMRRTEELHRLRLARTAAAASRQTTFEWSSENP